MDVVKTLRFHLPVLEQGETAELLDIVTAIDGVAAAIVDVPSARLEVAVTSAACGLIVREEIAAALMLSGDAVAA